MRLTGKLIKWQSDKAFGFIAPNGGGEHVFIHKTALNNRKRTPQINDVISFKVGKDKQGRYCAEQAIFAGEKLQRKRTKQINKFSIYLSVIFMALITASYFLGHLPQKLTFIYLGTSIVSFCAYAVDKSKAQRDVWRTRESTLHLLALIGGWPGAAIAQQLFRHKTKKVQFRTAFWLTVIANTLVLAWLMTPQGESSLLFLT